MWDLVSSGGFMMIPLIISSIILMAILIERYWFFKEVVILPENLIEDAIRLHKKSSTKELDLLRKHSLLGELYVYLLTQIAQGKKNQQEILEEALDTVSFSLEKYLTTLGVLASIAPLLGLLGTIFGIIRIFSQMILHGNPETHLLASGISEALITTATGLIVAIPSIIAYRFLLRKVDYLMFQLNKCGKNFLEAIKL